MICDRHLIMYYLLFIIYLLIIHSSRTILPRGVSFEFQLISKFLSGQDLAPRTPLHPRKLEYRSASVLSSFFSEPEYCSRDKR